MDLTNIQSLRFALMPKLLDSCSLKPCQHINMNFDALLFCTDVKTFKAVCLTFQFVREVNAKCVIRQQILVV